MLPHWEYYTIDITEEVINQIIRAHSVVCVGGISMNIHVAHVQIESSQKQQFCISFDQWVVY